MKYYCIINDGNVISYDSSDYIDHNSTADNNHITNGIDNLHINNTLFSNNSSNNSNSLRVSSI